MNTNGHLTAGEVEALCQPTDAPGKLPASERLAISDHLAGCAACRALVAAAGVPSGDQRRLRLAAERQALIAAARQEASREAEDLQTFARSLTAFPAERFEPGGTLPAPAATRRAVIDTRATAPGIRWWNALFSSPVFVAAGVAAFAGVAVLVTLAFSEGKSVGRPLTARAGPLLEDGPVVVAADGRLHTDVSLPEDLRLAMAAAIAQRSLRVSAGTMGTLRGEAGLPAMGAGATPEMAAPFPVVPAPGATVENERPRLQWTSVPGSTDYLVEITLPAGGKTLFSPHLPAAQTSWQPESPLERGRIYHWRVLASTPSGTLPGPGDDRAATSSFKVLGVAGEEELRQLRAAPHLSHLALAIACARLELRSEAKEELKILCDNNPHSLLAIELSDSLDAYPHNPAARQAVKPQTKESIPQ